MAPRSQLAEDVKSLGSFRSESKPPEFKPPESKPPESKPPESKPPVATERQPPPDRGGQASSPPRMIQLLAAGATVLALAIGVVVWSAWRPSVAAPAIPQDGSLRVDSDPSGAEVLVDGVSRGNTPSAMRLAVGSHQLVVRRDGHTHARTVTIAPGSALVHVVAWESAPAPAQPLTPTAAAVEPVRPTPSVPLGWVTVRSAERLDVYEGLRRM